MAWIAYPNSFPTMGVSQSIQLHTCWRSRIVSTHEFISVLQMILLQQKKVLPVLEHLHCKLWRCNPILKKVFESFKAANYDSPIIEGPHTYPTVLTQ